MQYKEQTILDDNGIEINVGYEYEASKGYYEEQNNIASWVEGTVLIQLKTVELIIKGGGIDITQLLNEKQKEFIKSKLFNYESI